MIYFAGTRKVICIEMWLRMLQFPQLIFSLLEVLMVSFGIITLQLFINSFNELVKMMCCLIFLNRFFYLC